MLNSQEIVKTLKQIRSAVLSNIYRNLDYITFKVKEFSPEGCTVTFTTNEGSRVKYETHEGIKNCHALIEIEGQVVGKPFRISFHSNMGEPFNGTVLVGGYGIAFWHVSDMDREPIIIPCRNILGKAVPICSNKSIEGIQSLIGSMPGDIETMTPADEETKSYLKSPVSEEERRRNAEKMKEKAQKEWKEEQLQREQLNPFCESSFVAVANLTEDEDDISFHI